MKFTALRFNESDIETRVSWINDGRINRTMFFDLPATVEKTINWFRSNIGNTGRIDFSFKDDKGQTLAMGGFTKIDQLSSNAEFYVLVDPEKHGQGIGKAVSFWMYNYAFSVLALNKIYLYTNDDNEAAYRIYERAGFTLEGTLRQHKFKDGRLLNRRIYGLLAEEWKNLAWKKEIDYAL